MCTASKTHVNSAFQVSPSMTLAPVGEVTWSRYFQIGCSTAPRQCL